MRTWLRSALTPSGPAAHFKTAPSSLLKHSSKAASPLALPVRAHPRSSYTVNRSLRARKTCLPPAPPVRRRNPSRTDAPSVPVSLNGRGVRPTQGARCAQKFQAMTPNRRYWHSQWHTANAQSRAGNVQRPTCHATTFATHALEIGNSLFDILQFFFLSSGSGLAPAVYPKG